MKKFMMIILAVALVASVASAATMNITGSTAALPDQTKPGDTLTMNWFDNSEVYGGFGDVIINVSQGNFVSAAYANIGWLLKADPVVTVNGAGFDIAIGASAFPIPANTGNIFTLVFTVPTTAAAQSKVNIAVTTGGYNQMFGADLPSASLTVVPEPVTLVLLGLGGLFLRRRK